MMSFVLAYYAIMKKCMPMSEEKTGKKDYERLRVAAENLYIENGMDGRGDFQNTRSFGNHGFQVEKRGGMGR